MNSVEAIVIYSSSTVLSPGKVLFNVLEIDIINTGYPG